jgi:hypothetical protein
VKQIKNDRLLKFLCRVGVRVTLTIFCFFFGWCDSPNIKIKQKQTFWKKGFYFSTKMVESFLRKFWFRVWGEKSPRRDATLPSTIRNEGLGCVNRAESKKLHGPMK